MNLINRRKINLLLASQDKLPEGYRRIPSIPVDLTIYLSGSYPLEFSMKFNKESIPEISEGEAVSTEILTIESLSSKLLIISSLGGILLFAWGTSTMNVPSNYTILLMFTAQDIKFITTHNNMIRSILHQPLSLPIKLSIMPKSPIEEFKINDSKYIPCADSEGTKGYWDVTNKNFITNNTIGE